jgi:hypothetical protein
MQRLREIPDSDRVAPVACEAVLDYLNHRFESSPDEWTTDQIRSRFFDAGIEEALTDRTVHFVALCEAAQFGPPSCNGHISLRRQAEQLLSDLEESHRE